MVKLKVYLEPGRGRNEILGWKGQRLHIIVSKKPQNNEANDRMIKVLHDDLDFSSDYSMRIIGDQNSREKTVEIYNCDQKMLIRHLTAAGFGPEEE